MKLLVFSLLPAFCYGTTMTEGLYANGFQGCVKYETELGIFQTYITFEPIYVFSDNSRTCSENTTIPVQLQDLDYVVDETTYSIKIVSAECLDAETSNECEQAAINAVSSFMDISRGTFVCTCDNGSPATGSECTSDGVTCVSCNVGYFLSGTACEAYTCTCDNGVAATGADCTSNGAKCMSCNDRSVLVNHECKILLDAANETELVAAYRSVNSCTLD